MGGSDMRNWVNERQDGLLALSVAGKTKQK